ncbi:MAG: hypothetical protein QW291_04815 [Thermofilaceae archaeon]
MSSVHLRNALNMLEELLRRDDVSGEAKKTLIQVKSEVIAAQDELLWARGRAKEAYHVLEELAELLGAEVKSRRVSLIKDIHLKQLEASPHLEAVVSEDGKVKIARVALAKNQ